MSVNINGTNYTTWDDVQEEFFTPEKIAESDAHVKKIGEEIQKNRRQTWEEAFGLIRVDDLEPTLKFRAMVEKEIRGEITDEDLLAYIKEIYGAAPKPNATTLAAMETTETGEDMYSPFDTVDETMEAFTTEPEGVRAEKAAEYEVPQKKRMRSYPAVFTYESGQKIAVVFPDLYAATSGVNEIDAVMSARELLRCILHGLMDDGEPFPAPTALKDISVDPNEKAVLVTTEVGTGYDLWEDELAEDIKTAQEAYEDTSETAARALPSKNFGKGQA